VGNRQIFNKIKIVGKFKIYRMNVLKFCFSHKKPDKTSWFQNKKSIPSFLTTLEFAVSMLKNIKTYPVKKTTESKCITRPQRKLRKKRKTVKFCCRYFQNRNFIQKKRRQYFCKKQGKMMKNNIDFSTKSRTLVKPNKRQTKARGKQNKNTFFFHGKKRNFPSNKADGTVKQTRPKQNRNFPSNNKT
jgi:hypothetical protein